jgi:hypothetical protein
MSAGGGPDVAVHTEGIADTLAGVRCPESVSSLALEPPTEPIRDAPGQR